jgi:hypothetical protein
LNLRGSRSDDRGCYILHSEVEKAMKEMRDKKAKRLQEMIMYLGVYSDCWEKMASS